MKIKNSCVCPKGKGKLVCTMYKCNYSAFNGYRKTFSDYSQIVCRRCGAVWRSKGKFVDTLPKEENI